jgi:hypothetical protein
MKLLSNYLQKNKKDYKMKTVSYDMDQKNLPRYSRAVRPPPQD